MLDDHVQGQTTTSGATSTSLGLVVGHPPATSTTWYDIRAPYERQSSLSLYEKRCEMLKRLDDDSSSDDGGRLQQDTLSICQGDASSKPAVQHQDQDASDDGDEDIDDIVREFKTSKHD